MLFLCCGHDSSWESAGCCHANGSLALPRCTSVTGTGEVSLYAVGTADVDVRTNSPTMVEEGNTILLAASCRDKAHLAACAYPLEGGHVSCNSELLDQRSLWECAQKSQRELDRNKLGYLPTTYAPCTYTLFFILMSLYCSIRCLSIHQASEACLKSYGSKKPVVTGCV